MNAWTVILDIVLILISIVLIIAVLLQQVSVRAWGHCRRRGDLLWKEQGQGV